MVNIPEIVQPTDPRLREDPLTGQRTFVDMTIQKQIDDAICTLEAGSTGAVIAYVNGEEVGASVVGKKGEHWSVVVGGHYVWRGLHANEFGGLAAVRFQW